MFDWMAQERGAARMSMRHFKTRLPEIHKKFPQLTKAFMRMDMNNDCWLEWEEFASFCLRDERMKEMMRRAMTVSVYGRDKDGSRTYKDSHDPTFACETGMPTPILPWESAHVVEWRIEGLRLSRKGSPATYAGVVVRPGTSIASPPFRAAGINGFLRFWPAGFYTETNRRKKASAPPGENELISGGHCLAPCANSWCCIGACLPHGSHLILRFFVGDESCARRECFWSEGIHSEQLWAPSAQEAPADLIHRDELIVGVEILRNLGKRHGRPHPKQIRHSTRINHRPELPDPDPVNGSVLLGRARSFPSLPYGRECGAQADQAGDSCCSSRPGSSASDRLGRNAGCRSPMGAAGAQFGKRPTSSSSSSSLRVSANRNGPSNPCQAWPEQVASGHSPEGHLADSASTLQLPLDKRSARTAGALPRFSGLESFA